ncbi:MAG TPA: N-acetylmuramoyl-L-alanine amidase [Vicinamibacteria bacterium]|nr:N-acetylmuramoyl-L-alanine amidase [Vicinamibacteria bacterium]
MGFARVFRVFRSSALLSALCVPLSLWWSVPAQAASSSRPDRTLYYEAKGLRTRLEGSKTLLGRKAEWDRVVLRFRTVVARYPQSPYCDDALLAVGDLYRQMSSRFKSTTYKDAAARAYRMLVAEYPSSSLGEGALYAVFEMAAEGSDRKRIEDAARLYLAAFPDSKRAASVKAAVRRKAPEQVATLPSPPPRGLVPVFNVRSWSGENSTRLVVDLDKEVKFQSDRIANPDRLWIDLAGTRLHPNLTDRVFPVGDGLLEQVRVAQNRDSVVRVVLDFKSVKDHQVFYLQNPTRLVVDVRGNEPEPARVATRTTVGEELEIPDLESAEPAAELERQVEERLKATAPTVSPSPTPAPSPATPAAPAPAAPSPPAPSPSPAATPAPGVSATPTPPPSKPSPPPPAQAASKVAEATPAPVAPPAVNRTGSYSLARQLGLGARRIVIDPGHGGHDPGTIGRGGLQEKELVLDVALRLGRLVREELGAEVVMTRSTDVFIPLEERTAIANQKDADLFLSIHANSSRSPRARGIETYYLNFAGDPHAEEVAARENAISTATMKDLQGLLKAIALNSKIDESREFASTVHESLVANLRQGRAQLPDRGVKTAPFYVLIGANMPSILAEIAFVSNPDDEKLLRSSGRREEVARGLLRGVKSYLDGLNRGGVKLTRGGGAPRLAGKDAKP